MVQGESDMAVYNPFGPGYAQRSSAAYVNPQGQWMSTAGTILGTAGGILLKNLASGSSSTATEGRRFPEGSDIDILSEQEAKAAGLYRRRRRRRRRLLTCSDKADIAFLHGQLGGGALGRAAISSLLSRRCG